MTLLYILCGIYAGLFPMIILKLLRIKKEFEERESKEHFLWQQIQDLQKMSTAIGRLNNQGMCEFDKLNKRVDRIERQMTEPFIHDLVSAESEGKNK